MADNNQMPSATKLVRDALRADGSSSPDYDKIARDVISKIDKAEYESYLFEFIKLRIPHQINDGRNSAIKALQHHTPTFSAPEPEPQTFLDPDGPAPKLVRTPTNSAKVDAMRQRAFEERVTVADNARKMLKELTYEDCIWIVADRNSRSKQLSSAADMYQQFADALFSSGKTTLGELPDDFKRILNPKLV